MCLFLNTDNPLLNQRAQEVALHDIPMPAIQTMISQMYEAAHGERTDACKRSLVGLAAPQIGISKRIILVDMAVSSERTFLGDLQVFINPEILWHSEKILWDREGCFSVDKRIGGVVPRAESIKLIAYDRQGNPLNLEISGFTARIFQHEIDHLNGILFPDRIGKDGTLHWVEHEEFADYRNHWQDWPARCPWEKWASMKNKA